MWSKGYNEGKRVGDPVSVPAVHNNGLISFSMPDLSAHAQEAYDSLAIVDLNFENVWAIFTAMLVPSCNNISSKSQT